jgi:G:T-mismatch repair DNA endonuclease (very short patch repair protein)
MNKKLNFYCSKECNATGRVNNVLKHPYFRIGKFKDTSIELKLQKILTEHGIKFEKHVSMEGHPDIFIKPNICIFADGDYFHNLPGRKERDAAVTATLTDKGYRVLRFCEHDINSNINSCFNTIQEHAYVA